jgi:hypothetical protein
VLVLVCAVGALAAPVTAARKPPATWDARIQPIASKVEALRGLKFDHPVEVDFLSDAAFEKKVAVDKGKLSKQDKQEIATAQSQLRAVGLIGADVDIVDATSSLQTSGVLAYYDPKTKKVTVKGTSVDDVGLRVTLAHELTHALQDQHFDLQKLERSAARAHASTPLRTLVEGDAVRVQRAYVDSLSQADQQAYTQEQQQQSTTARAEITSKGVPEALSVLFEAPYDLGPIMVDAVLAKQHEAGIDALFRKPPTSDSSYLTPSTLLDGSRFATVQPPKLAAGEHAVGKPDVFGAFALYQVLASRLDPATALTAADAWGGDAMVTFTRKGVTCLRSTFVGRNADGTHEIGDSITQWAAAMPPGTAQADARADHATLTACDPGASATEAPNRAVAALVLVASRDELFLEVVQQSLPVPVAVCIADTLVRDPAFQPILDAGANDASAGPDQAALDAVRARAPEILSECTKSTAA